jgi:hypothetical protein
MTPPLAPEPGAAAPAGEPAAAPAPVSTVQASSPAEVARLALDLSRFYREIGHSPVHPSGDGRGCTYPEDYLVEAAELAASAAHAIAGDLDRIAYRGDQVVRDPARG